MLSLKNTARAQGQSFSAHWEFMYARSMFHTPDIGAQGKLLAEVARLVDEAKIRTTLTEVLRPINAANVQQAHSLIENGKTKGEVVLEGF